MKKILVMAGGTGGHVFPGIAVAKELSKNNEFEVLWLGTAERMEAKIVPQNGFKIAFIKVQGLRRNGLWRKLCAPFMIARAIGKAISIMRKFKPDVVLGLGGYASGPGGIAARLLGIPLVLHEQNAAPGFTNKLLSKIASKVLLGFSGALQGDNVSYVGNPVRSDVMALRDKLPRDFKEEILRISIIGGSLGAQALNEIVPKAIEYAQNKGAKLEVLHQTGRGNAESVKVTYSRLNCSNVRITEFVDDMAFLYANTHLIICRAGAGTVSEVAASALPAIFIPLPTAVDDHQTKNAKVLADIGGAILIPQSQLSAATLGQKLFEIYEQRSMLVEMSSKLASLPCLDAAKEVADVCRSLALNR